MFSVLFISDSNLLNILYVYFFLVTTNEITIVVSHVNILGSESSNIQSSL